MLENLPGHGVDATQQNRKTHADNTAGKVEMIRVLLVDDLPSVRQGLRMRLALEPDLEVVGEACDGIAALSAAARLLPDVVVMDLEMPGMDGISATRELSGHSLSAVIILSICEETGIRVRALEAGACAYVTKGEGVETLLRAIRCAATSRRG